MENLNNIVSRPYNPNFGDAVAFEFFQSLVDETNYLKKVSLANNSIVGFLTIGSILRFCKQNHIILGTGFISTDDDLGKGDWLSFNNTVYSKPLDILSVRGPKTRSKLLSMGIDCPENYGDPLLIFPLICNPKVNLKYDIGLIPHYIDINSMNYNFLKSVLINKYKVKEINILTGIKYTNFISNIKKCEYIISSSLHGVIMGLVYGKKTIYCPFSNKVVGNGFKFDDFFESLGIRYKPHKFDNPNLLNNYITFRIEKILALGNSIIQTCPFISDERKITLLNNWNLIVEKLY